MDLLIESKVSTPDDDLTAISSSSQKYYTLNTDMVEFIRAIKNKYRVYLFTRLEKNDCDGSTECCSYDTKEYEQINELLMKLVK